MYLSIVVYSYLLILNDNMCVNATVSCDSMTSFVICVRVTKIHLDYPIYHRMHCPCHSVDLCVMLLAVTPESGPLA